jgi:hypothetical protein
MKQKALTWKGQIKAWNKFLQALGLAPCTYKRVGGGDTKHIVVMMDWAQSNSNKPRTKGHG